MQKKNGSGQANAPDAECEELATINIGNINGGAAVGQFEIALEKILANIMDLSTVATATRSITMQFVFKPHSDRIKVETEVHVSAKLAPCEASKAQLFLGKTEAGGLVALDSDPRQMPLWKTPAPVEAPVIQFSNGSR